MPTLIGTYQTPNAAKYLQQLCKHFAHKIDATHDETTGFAPFIFGPAKFAADAQTLSVTFDLNNCTDIPSAKHVIDAHLERFAHREDFKTMQWSET